jgi:hypothetical protein
MRVQECPAAPATHDLLTTPMLMDDRALKQLIRPIHKTSYSDGIKLIYEAYASARMSN